MFADPVTARYAKRTWNHQVSVITIPLNDHCGIKYIWNPFFFFLVLLLLIDARHDNCYSLHNTRDVQRIVAVALTATAM